MKHLIFSINPPWVERILTGEHPAEQRQWRYRFKGSVPFRMYFYETKNLGGCGKVIGYGTCYRVTIEPDEFHGKYSHEFHLTDLHRIEPYKIKEAPRSYREATGFETVGMHTPQQRNILGE